MRSADFLKVALAVAGVSLVGGSGILSAEPVGEMFLSAKFSAIEKAANQAKIAPAPGSAVTANAESPVSKDDQLKDRFLPGFKKILESKTPGEVNKIYGSLTNDCVGGPILASIEYYGLAFYGCNVNGDVTDNPIMALSVKDLAALSLAVVPYEGKSVLVDLQQVPDGPNGDLTKAIVNRWSLRQIMIEAARQASGDMALKLAQQAKNAQGQN